MSRSAPADEFVNAVEEMDTAGLERHVELAVGELRELGAGLSSVPDPVGAACRVILGDWQQLDAPARVAALLVFANALSLVTTPR